MNQELLDRFLGLCVIEAPSKKEGPMARRIRSEIGEMGLVAREDGTSERTGSEVGNLIVEVPPSAAGALWITLMAHMDAVPPGRGAEPYIEDGLVRSRGQILSADDRAGISIALQILKDVRRTPLGRLGLQVIFTVSEETGVGGAEALAREDIKGDFCVVLDTGGPPGQVNFESPTAKKFRMTCEGRSAHAGIEPEKGINALLMASRIISSLPSGRLDPDTTFSFTVLRAGSATNVVPEQAVAEGELRTFKPGEPERLLALIEEKAREVERECGGRVTLTAADQFPPYRVDPENAYLKKLLAAAADEGFSGFLKRSGGGSDANPLNAKGIRAVNVGVGYRHGHSPHEHLIVEELDGTYRWIGRFLRSLDETG